MKIAIHHRTGSFSDKWISYCRNKGIDYKIVNAFDSNIISQVKDCDAFIWHHHHGRFKDVLTAKRILFALEQAGLKVFPDFNTGWHFDDKVAQKYLLEAISAPLVPSYVFYDKQEALDWAKDTIYPKVWKLKGGAGASNVKLVNSYNEAIKYINKAFAKGFPQFNKWNNLNERIRIYNEGKDSVLGILKGIGRLIIPTEYSKLYSREKGYIYFQEFVPNNDHDTRVVVINGKYAAAEKRYVRENDFRASGSGKYSYKNINLDTIELAFKVANHLKLQSVAFDFIFDNNSPLIVEISYGFGTGGISKAPGYWTNDLNWHEEVFNPETLIIQALIDIK